VALCFCGLCLSLKRIFLIYDQILQEKAFTGLDNFGIGINGGNRDSFSG